MYTMHVCCCVYLVAASLLRRLYVVADAAERLKVAQLVAVVDVLLVALGAVSKSPDVVNLTSATQAPGKTRIK